LLAPPAFGGIRSVSARISAGMFGKRYPNVCLFARSIRVSDHPPMSSHPPSAAFSSGHAAGGPVPPEPPAPLSAAIREGWMLDPAVHYLNHGSFGARRHRVMERQTAWRVRLESQPVAFLDRDLPELLRSARQTIGAMLGMEPESFGFVTNATEGVNAVLRSLDLRPGDRLVTTTHVYRAVGKAMRFAARRSGAEVIEVPLPLPARDPADVVALLARALAPDASGRAARLLVIDHVTSPSALVLPVREIIAAARDVGTLVLLDGAHAPGMLPLDVRALAPDWYTANLHKWICAPPGAAFLWSAAPHRDATHPLVISHYLDEGFSPEFAWQGTRDVTAWLASADAVRDVCDALGPGGWAQVMAHNHCGARWAGGMLSEAFATPLTAPEDGSMTGSMVAVEIPPSIAQRHEEPARLQAMLRGTYSIEIPVMVVEGRWYLRPSYQVYNRPESYELLARACLRGD